jgi:hypothetical protein
MRCKAIRFVMSVSPTELSSGLPLSFYPNEREDIPRKFPLFFGATPFFGKILFSTCLFAM